MFVGYIDVVLFGDEVVWSKFFFDVEIEDGVLWGCGVVDMKGVLVVMVVVILCYFVDN